MLPARVEALPSDRLLTGFMVSPGEDRLVHRHARVLLCDVCDKADELGQAPLLITSDHELAAVEH